MSLQEVALGEDENHEREARTARLLRLSADQIAHFSTETILAWLDAHREQRVARLRAACQTLRDLNARQARAYARLAAALAHTTEEPK
ncbi:hypothetical protein ABT081_02535 [Streptomyces sp. NPDC002238]|uniref:hypothetical protein n=1 Tax=Streptomyces sp. NPDC002238 TaxID=3156649 RepID=UPI003324B67A